MFTTWKYARKEDFIDQPQSYTKPKPPKMLWRVESNMLSVLNAVQFMSSSGIINNKTQVQIIHMNL